MEPITTRDPPAFEHHCPNSFESSSVGTFLLCFYLIVHPKGICSNVQQFIIRAVQHHTKPRKVRLLVALFELDLIDRPESMVVGSSSPILSTQIRDRPRH